MDSYEKKYKEAIKACKELSDTFDNETLTEELEKIFPELCESEDDRIWSEEDEKCIKDLLHYLEHYSILTSEREKCINWLKSLKDRVQLQPKQEWSEEEK